MEEFRQAVAGQLQSELVDTGRQEVRVAPEGAEPKGAPSRVNVSFTPRARESLQRLADEQGKTISETLRDALRLAQYVHDLQKEKGKLLVERDGKIQELVLM